MIAGLKANHFIRLGLEFQALMFNTIAGTRRLSSTLSTMTAIFTLALVLLQSLHKLFSTFFSWIFYSNVSLGLDALGLLGWAYSGGAFRHTGLTGSLLSGNLSAICCSPRLTLLGTSLELLLWGPTNCLGHILFALASLLRLMMGMLAPLYTMSFTELLVVMAAMVFGSFLPSMGSWLF